MADPKGKTPNAEILDLLADLDSQFGKKAKGKKEPSDADIRKSRNTAWHQANQPIERTGGKAPELDQSGNWQPIARVTYIIRQTCMCCNNTVEFIGGEYVQFESKKQHARTLRPASYASDLFLYREDDEPLEDLIDEHNQLVSRCPGCIAVERRAIEIWEAATERNPQIEIEGVVPPVTSDLPEFKEP